MVYTLTVRINNQLFLLKSLVDRLKSGAVTEEEAITLAFYGGRLYASREGDHRDGGECWVFADGKHPFGYGAVALPRMGKKPHMELAHRLSYRVFRGDLQDGQEVLHRCDVPGCFHPFHLFSGTQADNMKDMVAKGRQCAGEKNGMAKLTAAEVEQIRALKKEGKKSSVIAKLFGVTPQHVYQVITQRRWK